MIRKATVKDAPAVKILLNQLHYPTENGFLEERIPEMLALPDMELLIFEEDKKVLGFVTLCYMKQVAVKGDFAIISYFVVDQNCRNRGIGKALEAYCTQLAIARKCDKIQLHSHMRRTDAHQFYERQGYLESRKYFTKNLKQ